jgi:hypothetical protein
MKPRKGTNPTLCTAPFGQELPDNGKMQPHGIISYYAAKALTTAKTATEWKEGMEKLEKADTDAGILEKESSVEMLVVGDQSIPPPGMPPDKASKEAFQSANIQFSARQR